MRKIHIVPSGGVGAARQFDSITNPVLLSHAIFDFDSRTERVAYDMSIRMSSLADVCIREKYLGCMSHASFTKHVPLGMLLTFDIGHAVHDYLQNCGRYFTKKRKGWWECLSCGGKYFGTKIQANCRWCKASVLATRYKEHSLKVDGPYFTTGHIDCFTEVLPGDDRVTDFKTLNGKEFEKLVVPKGEHCIQVVGYMVNCEYDKTLPIKVNPDRGLLVYINKQHQGDGLPFKTFHVNRTSLTETYVRDTLGGFTEAVKSRIAPPVKLECRNSDFLVGKAKRCPMKDQCVESHSRGL